MARQRKAQALRWFVPLIVTPTAAMLDETDRRRSSVVRQMQEAVRRQRVAETRGEALRARAIVRVSV